MLCYYRADCSYGEMTLHICEHDFTKQSFLTLRPEVHTSTSSHTNSLCSSEF